MDGKFYYDDWDIDTESNDIPNYKDILFSLNSLLESFLAFYKDNRDGESCFDEEYPLNEEEDVWLHFDSAISNNYDLGVYFSYRNYNSKEYNADLFLDSKESEKILSKVAEEIEVECHNYWEEYYKEVDVL